jgi:nucleoside-diphosphate-sugar epimerase
MDKISIIGLGWLGLPLAQALQARGFSVTGSCTTPEKSQQLSAAGISATCWSGESGEPVPAALCAETVILTLPPSRCQDYPGLLQRILQQLVAADCQRVILISSTSVYGASAAGHEGEAPRPDSGRGERMLHAESLVCASGIPQWAILRPAGLFGPGRHPGRFLSGKATDDGRAPVNLVHLVDVVGILLLIVQQQAWGEVLNACAPSHPSRREFYRQACERLEIPPPFFGDEAAAGKQIDGSKVERMLGYSYQIPDPLAWLSQQPDV